MRNLLLISLILSSVIPLTASAEAVRCEGDRPAGKPAPFVLEFEQQDTSDPLNLPWNNAKLRNFDSNGRPTVTWGVGPYVRTRRASDILYANQNMGGGASRDFLVVRSTSLAGSNLPGEYTLEPNFRKAKVTCSITGAPVPPVAACPDAATANAQILKETKAQSPNPVRVEELLACGADANVKDTNGCTPLLYLTDLDCGKTPVAPDPGGHPGNPGSPVSPISGGHYRSGTLLIEQPLLDATNALLAGGGLINARDPITKRTALINVSRFARPKAIELLVELEANVDAQDSLGNTALMYSAMARDYWGAQGLLKARPDLKIKNAQGKTAHDIAKDRGYTDMMELLQPSDVTVVIEGKADRSCTPTMVHLQVGKPVEIVLQASGTMFLLTAPEFDLELMANPGESVKKTVTPSRTGTFPFTCGPHGGTPQTQGSFMVM